MSSKLVVSLIAVAVLVPLKSMRAEVIDMAAVTCGELISMKADEAGSILLWTHGYFGGLADDTKFDPKEFEAVAKEIGEYCAKNKKVTLISAIKALPN
jgi:acid stress chaperone HdeB